MYKFILFSDFIGNIGRDGFRVVLLLRLSPLLPFALSNYLYGLTSVPLSDYALGSFLGMIPGTVAYVAAGTVGKKLLLTPEGNLSLLCFELPPITTVSEDWNIIFLPASYPRVTFMRQSSIA